MEKFTRFVISFRIPVLLTAALVTALSVYYITKLYPDDDVMQFMPADDPDIQLFTRINKQFGGLDVAIVGIESDSLFTTEKIAATRQLTRKLGEIEGVFDVLSFTDVPDPQPSPDGLRVTPLVLDEIPETPEELAELKTRVLANENAVGNLISKDGKAAMVLCFLGGKRPPIHVAADIKKTAKEILSNDKVFFGGSPFIRLHIAGGTKKDLDRLTPVVALVVLLVTFLVFRKPLGVLLALGIVGVAIAWIMGWIAMRGEGLSLVSSSLPTILMAIGGAYGIHLLSGYFSGTATTVEGRIMDMMKDMGPPVIASAATTAAGFISFIVMDIRPLREYGYQAAAGVAITALLAFTVIPAVLSFSRHLPKGLGSAHFTGIFAKFGAFSARNRRLVLSLSLAVGLVSLLGIMRIAPDATMESFFAEDSEPALANDFLVRHFGGSNYLQIYFEGDMRSPFVLAELRKVVEYARGLEEVVQVAAITDPLTMMGEAMGGRADLPVNNRRTGFLYPFLEGTAAIEQMISREKNASLVQIRLGDVGPERVSATVDRIRRFIDKEVPRGLKVVQIGDFAVPEEAAQDYADPEEVDNNGKVIKASRRMLIHQVTSDEELQRYRAALKEEVAGRILRIARMLHPVRPELSDAATFRVAKALPDHLSFGPLAPGADLDDAVAPLVTEHLEVDYSLEEPAASPEGDAPAEVVDPGQQEWKSRGERVKAALKNSNGVFLDAAKMRTLLENALPITAARDPEGIQITSEALAMGLAQVHSSIRAQRLVAPALEAAGIQNPSEELKTRVMWAMTDLDMPVYGFSDSGKDATMVLARVTGQPVINVAFCNSTINNQLKSLAASTVVLLLILAFMFRSAMSAIKGMAPSMLMMALSVGVMGALHIPIDLTTSMIASIAMGIGVDYAIHFLWRRRKRGESLAETTANVGPSIAANALQVAAGFLVLCASDVVPMQRFGALVTMTMILAALATFILLPALRAEGHEVLESENADAEAAQRSATSTPIP